MGRLTAKLVETASKVAITRNADGDTNYGSLTSVACLYRDISTLNQSANREETTIDGLLWFEAGEDANRGDIYYHSAEGYLRIIKVIRAKDLLRTNTEQFVKCEVAKQRQIS